MDHEIVLGRPPSKLAGYLHAVVLPRRSYQVGDSLPRIRITRRDLPIDPRHLAWFRTMCGYEPSPAVPFDYPLALCFHYHLGVFAHAAFPWSLRKVLGLRNHVTQHRRIRLDEHLDLTVATKDLRVRRKGIEFDIHTLLSSSLESIWESNHVYFLRGNFPHVGDQPPNADLPPLETVELETSWDAPRSGGLEFARLSGDLNPVHYLTPWARALGFRRAFCHTQRIVADCLRRLPHTRELTAADALRLDVAFKGPLYYGSSLTMKSARSSDGHRFDLHCDGMEKPAIAGYIRREG